MSKQNEEIQDLETAEIEEELQEENSENEENSGDDEVTILKKEIDNLKESLARKQADYQNFSARVERDKSEMTFFTTSKIVSKFLGTVDNIERILNSTPESEKENPVYKALLSTHKSLIKELESLWVKAFNSVWEVVDANKHDVMTQAPGELDVIVSEFEKWYEMWGKIIRHAKVVSGLWE